MAKFHNIKVADIYKETEDTSVVAFEIPSELHEAFKFRQGQHLTLKADIKGEDVRRSYSLCSSPIENQWKVAVKQIPGGKFSTYINESLKTGDELEVMAPSGTFGVEVKPEESKIYYFLTKERRDIELFNGRFDDEKMKVLTKTFIDIPDTSEVFLCGPEKMVNYVSEYLVNAGLPKELIHFELFVTGLSEEDIKRAERLAQQNVEGVEVTIVDGGKEFLFTMTKEYDNILDAALGAGADLPFACKGGVCSTCKCKVVEGAVEMKINYALDDKEVSQNLVLSCQSVPTAEKVVVDFDV